MYEIFWEIIDIVNTMRNREKIAIHQRMHDYFLFSILYLAKKFICFQKITLFK